MGYNNYPKTKFGIYFGAIGELLTYGSFLGGILFLISYWFLKLFGWEGALFGFEENDREHDIYFFIPMLVAWFIGVFILILLLNPFRKGKG